MLLVDEPDIHLHPSVQENLARSLLEIARAQGIKIIMTTHSPFIVRGAPADTNVVWLSEVSAQNQVPIKEQFVKQRAAHNEELHKAGGSPTNDDVWVTFQARPLKGAKGKYVFRQLKNKIPSNIFSDTTVNYHAVYPERAVSLKNNLEDLLA